MRYSDNAAVKPAVPQNHGFAQIQPSRQRNGPFGGQPNVLRIAAIAGFGQTAAGAKHRVAFTKGWGTGGNNVACHVDTAHQRRMSQDFSFAAASQCVFVVDR
jgi:hypothetical protein